MKEEGGRDGRRGKEGGGVREIEERRGVEKEAEGRAEGEINTGGF